jgi:protein-disulfide isomerase
MLKSYIKSFMLVGGLLLSLGTQAAGLNNLLRNPADPVIGNPKGKVTVVEFFDYQCSHCVTMARVMAEAVKSNPNLRVVYKEFPIRGPASQLAAQAALAANLQGKYAKFSHALFSARQPFSESTIYSVAASVGLDMKQLKHDMHDKAVTQQLTDNFKLAQHMRLTGTPAFFVGPTDAENEKHVSFILGEMSPRELQAAISKASQQK